MIQRKNKAPHQRAILTALTTRDFGRQAMLSRALGLAGSIATLTISSAAAQPTENRTTAAIQAQGVGATAIVGVQADSHLNVIMQQRASMNGPAPQAFAQGNAALHISTGISANQTSMHFNAASMHGTPAAAGINRAISTATPPWPAATGR